MAERGGGGIRGSAANALETAGSVTPYTREMPALERLAAAGFADGFSVDGGALRARQSGRVFRPQDLRIRDYFRFEGVSDPDDMSVVYALEATDGTRGILIDAFGAYADPDVGAVLDRILVDTPMPKTRRRRLALALALAGGVGAAVAIAVLLPRRLHGGGARSRTRRAA